MLLYLVRHAATRPDPDVPSQHWPLSAEGREAAHALGEWFAGRNAGAVYASTEPKAVETARPIARALSLPLQTDDRLGEVRRPFVAGDYEGSVARYFRGEALPGWEPPGEALARFRAAVAALREVGDVVLVSHGLVLTLFLGGMLGWEGAERWSRWRRIAFPDVALLDREGRVLVQPFGGRGV